MKKQTFGTVAVIVSALIFGITPVLARMTYEMGSNALTVTFFRNLFAVPILFLIVFLRKVPLKITAKEGFFLFLIGMCFSVPTTYLLFSAYLYIGIGLSTTIHFLYPIIIALFSAIVFKTKLSRPFIIALILATLGVALAGDLSHSLKVLGIVVAFISAITYSGYLLTVERSVIRNMDAFKAAAYISLFSILGLLLLNLTLHQLVWTMPFQAYLYMFIVALSNAVIGYVMLIYGIKTIGANKAAILSTFEPIGGIMSGIIFLGESLTIRNMLACTIILVAVLIPIVAALSKNRKKPLRR